MRYDLATLARRQRNIRRASITLREIKAPATLAGDLFTAVYKPVVDIWAQASTRIAAEYERTLAQMTTDAPSDLRAEIDAAESAFQRLLITLTPSLRNWAIRTEALVRNRWRGAVLSATGVDLSTMIGPEDVRATLESYIGWNVDLVKDVSAQAKKRISDAVFTGLTQRKPAREVAAEIREAVGMARDRSLRVASDQLAKISSSLADERRREAGLSVWAWVHSGKAHPRATHIARDGLLYSDAPGDVGKNVGGKRVRQAPEQGDRPSQPPYCGCRARSVMVFEFDGE